MQDMKRRQLLQLLTASPFLGLLGCTPNEVRRTLEAGQNLTKGDVTKALTDQIPTTGIPALDQLVRKRFEELAERLLKEWGDEKVASQKEYIKYTDEYQSRAIVNFETGVIRVETVDSKDSKAKLEQAIITTLLTPDDPSKVELLTDKDVAPNGKPFLLNLVLDHQGQPVRYAWRAQQYAKYLMRTAYKQDTYNKKARHFVTFNMVKNHQTDSQNKYAAYVTENTRRYKVKPSLVYAIMEAESSFNPYAISHIPAYGLMQIVPSSAGRDAHQLVYNKPGTPTKNYLFVPKNNIRMGTGYLSILNDRYLAKVTHPQSREYCVIAGYNTGSGNVLKAFDKDRAKAFDRINQLSPSQVYQQLVRNLPYEETRRYLQKVTKYQRKYA